MNKIKQQLTKLAEKERRLILAELDKLAASPSRYSQVARKFGYSRQWIWALDKRRCNGKD